MIHQGLVAMLRDLSTTPPNAAPDGWQLVPVEPTPKMIEEAAIAVAAWFRGDEYGNYVDRTPSQVRRVAYKAMLSAAPRALAKAAQP